MRGYPKSEPRQKKLCVDLVMSFGRSVARLLGHFLIDSLDNNIGTENRDTSTKTREDGADRGLEDRVVSPTVVPREDHFGWSLMIRSGQESKGERVLEIFRC